MRLSKFFDGDLDFFHFGGFVIFDTNLAFSQLFGSGNRDQKLCFESGMKTGIIRVLFRRNTLRMREKTAKHDKH